MGVARREQTFNTQGVANAELSIDERRSRLRVVADQVAPMALAQERTLPILDVLGGLFPDSGLRRGSVVNIGGVGATALALAVVAGASQAGSWTAMVGVNNLGWAAVNEAGVVLERLLVVEPKDQPSWITAMGALIGAVDVILVAPGRQMNDTTNRRLTSRLRERGSVVVSIGGYWTGADVDLAIVESAWSGLGKGHGLLEQRRVLIERKGKGSAARPTRLELLLPGHRGAPQAAPQEIESEHRWAGADVDHLVTAAQRRAEVTVLPLTAERGA